MKVVIANIWVRLINACWLIYFIYLFDNLNKTTPHTLITQQWLRRSKDAQFPA